MNPDLINNSDEKKDYDEKRVYDEKKRILRERAAKLSVEAAETHENEEIEVLKFMLDKEVYAVESKYIRGVYPLKRFTSVPCTPSHVTGIINIRGQILSVIDLGKFFELPRKGLSDLNQVIILNNSEMEFGILADEISGVIKVSANDIETGLPTLTDIRADYLRGVTKERLIILDGWKILTDERLIVNDEVHEII